MSKLAVTILVLRTIQLKLGIAFLVFWTWSCAVNYAMPGGAGEYFLGYFSSLASLTVCVHGIWSFAKKHHLAEHGALYHNARWAVDLAVVCLWLGVILIICLVPTPHQNEPRNPDGTSTFDDSTSSPLLTIGFNITSLFTTIISVVTALLLIIPAVKARRTKKAAASNPEVGEKGQVVDSGLQVPQAAHIPEHQREV